MIKITEDTFEKDVLQSEKPVLVDFWADWCVPCQMFAPILGEFEKEHESEIIVGKVNVEKEMKLARKYRVFSIPNLVLFKNGEAVDTSAGVMEKEELAAWVSKNL